MAVHMQKNHKPGDPLTVYRKREELTLLELADKIGVTAQRINEMEKGRREISKENAKKLAVVFGISPARFI
jgi:plasmid maintenance system antidote protein VapI